MKSAANLILFKVVYGLSLVGVAAGSPWWGAAGLIVFIAWHARTCSHARADFILAGTAVVLGLLVDTINIHSGVLVYNAAWPSPDLAPFWILVLWANFALIMNGGLRWLQGRYMLAAVIGAIAGPLGYVIGIKLNAAAYGSTLTELIVVSSISWAVALPLLLFLAERLRTGNYALPAFESTK